VIQKNVCNDRHQQEHADDIGQEAEHRALADVGEVLAQLSGTGYALVYSSARPRAMVMEPSVAMKGWIFV
jgi:phosphoglycolate phosphatase-like HAD superfamily hydrolase